MGSDDVKQYTHAEMVRLCDEAREQESGEGVAHEMKRLRARVAELETVGHAYLDRAVRAEARVAELEGQVEELLAPVTPSEWFGNESEEAIATMAKARDSGEEG